MLAMRMAMKTVMTRVMMIAMRSMTISICRMGRIG